MPYIYLLCAIVSSALLAVCGMLFNQKNDHREDLGHLYNLIGACSNFSTWAIVFICSPAYDFSVLPYAATYGINYALFWVGLTGALQCGSSALTGFIKQIAFVFVAVWGLLFWGSPITSTVVLGIALIAVALYLTLVPIGQKNTSKTNRISGKWIIYSLLILVGNAGCSIIQKTQQRNFDGAYGSFLMVSATFLAVIFCAVMCIKDDKSTWKIAIKGSWYFPIVAGSSSAICNLFLILLASTDMSPSLIYPALAIGGLALTTLVSTAICKDKLRFLQWVGLLIGAVALACLNV